MASALPPVEQPAYITHDELTKRLDAFERRIMEAVRVLSDEFAKVKKLDATHENALKILEDELVRVQNEIEVSQLIYSLHGCDSWEDMFRDNVPELEEKCRGIQVAIDEMKLTP